MSLRTQFVRYALLAVLPPGLALLAGQGLSLLEARTLGYGVVGLVWLLLAVVFLGVRLDRSVREPIESLRRAVNRLAPGSSLVHVIPDGPECVNSLGQAYNAAVDRLRAQWSRLDEAQGYLDAVITQTPEGLLVLDPRGHITLANAAAEDLLGQPTDRLVGRTVLSVLMSYTLDAEILRVLAGTRGEPHELRTPEGRTLRAAVGPLVVRGQPEGALVMLQDVTELRRADEMRRDFVANVSHEMRTPATALRAMAETLILRGAKRPELAAEYLPRMVEECERIDHLVRDLLLLAETESGQFRMQREPLDPRELAEEVVRHEEALAAQGDTRLVVGDFPDARVEADRFALTQCLRNLVHNALRYAAGGTVTLGAREVEGLIRIFVADTGPGIPPEDLPRIFERFYRVDKARSRAAGGSGLGLSLVKHLVEAQGGRAWAESQLGVGSTFYLDFPRLGGRRKLGNGGN